MSRVHGMCPRSDDSSPMFDFWMHPDRAGLVRLSDLTRLTALVQRNDFVASNQLGAAIDRSPLSGINPSLHGCPDRLRTADVLTFGPGGQLREYDLVHPDRDHLARPLANRAPATLAQLLNRVARFRLIGPGLDLLFRHWLAPNRLSDHT
jgi:hypothetical protein